jgi:2-keto-4-pentenoate hydratase/2-oxohepta-3-ene-1,7-dioic acid hydratase in catechol pathway
MHLRFDELMEPLPEMEARAWAFALTYRVHQAETRQTGGFFFEKRGAAEAAWNPICYRPALDYEAEVALLFHRNEPERYGFLLANDLTDRSIQVRNHDPRHPGPGFTAAKSFPGSLRVGPLLVIGDSELWPDLEIRLTVNGELRQHVRARDCMLSPRAFFERVFSVVVDADWALVLSGTGGGTIFQSPTGLQRLGLLFRSGFSIRRARENWLNRFRFLDVGDRLEIASDILGTTHATIVAGHH